MNKPILREGVYIELRGQRRLVAEGIDALLEYGDSRITVGAGDRRIAFAGQDMEMRYLSEDRIVIEGVIREIRYEE